ncbi:3-dehydroquinate synthase [Luteibaculum oceani]|uniref:3-dehydroquinate synthase n=1 Tax=Luteibaculum oceani TaxID=1294296 RepID=A0A5C6V0E1_9FLAO|nr:3-dehydroquinate synthase family protein [Luteibaculum oceani]TXC78374.1 3-dehydroquinate synthase [Luteibaculum oceani]
MQNVFFEHSNFEHLNRFFSDNESKYSTVFILTDSNVYKHCISQLLQNVPHLNGVEIIELDPGEGQKNIEIAHQLWVTLLEMEADKNSLFLNFGGGVISDLGGFIAGTYKRGIDYINVPTTLLAAVDAALGGKTGLDLAGVKNQIGLINNAKGVFVAPHLFETLPALEFESGLAECVKHMLISNETIWNGFLESENAKDFVIVNLEVLAKVKLDIVARDPFEKNERQFLNYGHTIGHAVEALFYAQNKSITHGVAVVWGMIVENLISCQLGMLSHSNCETINAKLADVFDLPNVSLDSIDSIVEFTRHDKKNEDGEIRCCLLKEIGAPVSKVGVAEVEVKKALEEAISRFNS